MAIVTTDDKHYHDIAQAMRDIRGEDGIRLKPSQMADFVRYLCEYEYSRGESSGRSEGYNSGYDMGYFEGEMSGIEQGKKAEFNRSWDDYQDRGTRVNYDLSFAGLGWWNGNFTPTHAIKPTTAYMMFRSTYISGDFAQLCADNGIVFDTSNLTNAQYMFSNATQITRIGELDFRKVTNGNSTFENCNALKTIDKIIVSDTTPYTGMFNYCYALANITFEGVIGQSISFANCVYLTNASIQSIIDHLKDLTGLTAKTLTFRAEVGAKLTAEQKAAITSKNWTLVY